MVYLWWKLQDKIMLTMLKNAARRVWDRRAVLVHARIVWAIHKERLEQALFFVFVAMLPPNEQ